MTMPGYPCTVCQRESAAMTVQTPTHYMGRDFNRLCSIECATIFLRGYKTMRNITRNEREAAFVGGKSGGAYLDEIGKSDLGDLSREEFTEFCARVFAGACEHLRKIADDEIPF